MTQEKLLKAAGLGREISAREAWKLFGIMAEFFEATERLAGVRPAVSVFGSAREARDALLPARGRNRATALASGLCRVLRRRPRPYGGDQQGRLRRRRHGGGTQHRSAARAALQSLPAHQPALQAFLRAQGDVRQIRERLYRAARRLRHARRIVRGTD